MRWASLLSLFLLTAGCGAPRLDLVFSVPDVYGDAVQKVVLQTYQPRGASAFGCEELAFGQVEQGVLRGSLVDEVVLTDEGVYPLADIDRVGTKVLLIEGFDANDEAVVRGCTELGTITQDEAVTVLGEPVAKVKLIDAPSLSRVIGSAIDAPIALGVVDVKGRPLATLQIFWEVVGVQGVASMGQAVTDGQGEVSIRPALPARPGPFLLAVRARWVEPGPPLATGFMSPPVEAATLPGRVVEYRFGQVGPAGEPGLVALLNSGIGNDVQVGFLYRSAGRLVQAISPSIPNDGAHLGLFEFRETPDRAVVVSRSSWIEVAPDGILTPRDYTPPVAATGALPQVVLPTGPCFATPDTPWLLVTYAANAVGFYDVGANFVGGFGQRLDVLSSGCVDDQDGVAIRTLVIDGGAQVGLAVAAEVSPDMYVTRSWVAVGSGTAFSSPVGDSGHLLLGTQLNVNDFVVSRARWQRAGESVELSMQGLDSPPEIPIVNQAGDIDGDQTLDVLSLFRAPSVNGSPARWAIWGVLGKTHRDVRMSGTFDLGDARRANPTLKVMDFDGDGVDDLVLAERSDPTIAMQTQTRIEIYSMGLVVQ